MLVTPKLVNVTVPLLAETARYVVPTVAVTPILVMVTDPVELLTRIPDPADKEVTPDVTYEFTVAEVNTTLPPEYIFVAYNVPPTPTPPATVNAPVLVDVAVVISVTDISDTVILVAVIAWPTNKPPATPTPPATVNAPVLVEFVAVVLVTERFPKESLSCI